HFSAVSVCLSQRTLFLMMAIETALMMHSKEKRRQTHLLDCARCTLSAFNTYIFTRIHIHEMKSYLLTLLDNNMSTCYLYGSGSNKAEMSSAYTPIWFVFLIGQLLK
ncbi:MAG TPA: hypothetical protein VHA52_01480, partial [Candidatus Babeliaceae bacterium]|nr:hypothetical protein [Candidatus Babeliaceae bacterium]